jgi:hypothetical protein
LRPHAKNSKQKASRRVTLTILLTVTVNLKGVVALPGLAATGGGLVVAVALVETTGLLAGSGETTRLAVLRRGSVNVRVDGRHKRITHLVHGLHDPVDPWVTADGLVLGVDKDDLKVLVGSILVDPVGVYDDDDQHSFSRTHRPTAVRGLTQHAQVGAPTSNTLLSGGPERPLVLELVDTLVGGLSIGGTLRDGLLAVTTANADAVDHIALLRLVTETAGLVGARRTRGTVDDVERAVLPAAYAEQEPKDIGLLLLGDLFNVLEGSHLDSIAPNVNNNFLPQRWIPAIIVLFLLFARIAGLRG